MNWRETWDLVRGVVVLGLLWGGGIVLLKHPEEILAKLNRPIEEKHLRAVRLIAIIAFTVAILASVQFALYVWRSN
jgi:hypothetical protein